MTNRIPLVTWIVESTREAAWAPLSLFGVYWLGLIFHVYKRFPSLDIPIHFLGGVAITYFYRCAIKYSQTIVGETPLPIQILLAITCTGTTAILWEFYENFADHFLGTHMVRGLEDTLMDLLMGLTGALVFTLLYRRR